MRFVPVVFETFGGLESVARFHLKHIASKAASKSSKPNDVVPTPFFREAISHSPAQSGMILAFAPLSPSTQIVGPGAIESATLTGESRKESDLHPIRLMCRCSHLLYFYE